MGGGQSSTRGIYEIYIIDGIIAPPITLRVQTPCGAAGHICPDGTEVLRRYATPAGDGNSAEHVTLGERRVDYGDATNRQQSRT